MNILGSSAPGEAEDGSWMMTYLDMMTLLLVVTLAMLALATKAHLASSAPAAAPTLPLLSRLDVPQGLALLQRRDSLPVPQALAAPPAPPAPAAPIAPAPPTEEQLRHAMGLDGLDKGIEVISQQGTLSFRLSSELLFATGQADLSPAGTRALQQLLPVLSNSGHQVLVEGHTDAEHMHSSRYPSNWELSSARAANVVRYLQGNGVDGPRLRAIGYGDTHPLADNNNAQGRARNRRVEIVLEATPAALAGVP